ncbi:unnamed protein product [Clonostachys rosea]|uniref:Ketoreductase (KR) domain-containing protein n=1 Tax=Bionectria ochroleuca TaxID=29856 RepID=A0ABY6U795_BIOOC|nr:unnamed protein product [Clonostachys rosea]
MASRTDRPLILIGSGPGIGRHIACEFASRRFNKVALLARNAERLAEDQAAIKAATDDKTEVRTYPVDITDDEEFIATLDKIEKEMGVPEVFYYNAARVTLSKLLESEGREIEYDFQINCASLYTAAKWAIPRLVSLADADAHARPSLLVTSSLLPLDPIPDMFALSMAKAAQRNMTQSLAKVYGPKGVHIGMVLVGGAVDPTHATLSPSNIASRTWGLFEEPKEKQTFEIQVV